MRNVGIHALCLAGLLAACARPPADPGPWPAAPVALADSLLVDIRQVEPTIGVDARYAGSDNFTGAPLPGYEAPRAWLRRDAAAALARVQHQLAADGLGLLVYDGYRPIRATLGMVDWATRTGQLHFVDDGYIARRSRHNLGAAVDLTLVRLATGQPLDMGTPYDTFSESAHTANATGVVAANRARLVRAMEDAGFRNYAQEWWHFSWPLPEGAPAFDVPIR